MKPRGPKPKTARNGSQKAVRTIPLNAIEPTSTLDVDALKHFYRLLDDLDRMGILERVDITLVTEAARIKECLDRTYEANDPIENASVIAQFTSRYQGLVRMLGLSVQPSRTHVKTVAKNQKQADPTASKIKLHAFRPHAVVDFINTLRHTGDFVGVPFALRPWQESIIRQIFDEHGNAKYRRVFIALPRKNGKTELIAAIALYLLLGTGKRSQNIYSASGDAEQAGLIHRAAATMIGQSEAMSAVCQVYQGNVKRIKVDPLGSEFRSLSSEAYSKFGLRPSVNLFDEVHVFPDGYLHTALETAFGATKDPLTIYITTAGYDRTSLCWELWERARSAKRDPASDPDFLGILYEFEEGDDWSDEAVRRKTNPALDDFCGIKEFRDAFQNAQRLPRKENGFRQFRLNQWTQQALRWLSVDSWMACGAKFDQAELIGQPCYAGFDGAVTGDMACYWMVFPHGEGVRVMGHGWAPRDGKWRDELRNKDRYAEWERQGFLTFTDGNTIDRVRVKNDICRYNSQYPIRQLFADRAYSMDLLTDLFNAEGMDVKGITHSPLSLNEPCVRLEELILSGKIEHGGNPLLNWNVANPSLKRGPTGLIYPDRSSATERIDGLMALIYALTAYIGDPESYEPSVYETRGLVYL